MKTSKIVWSMSGDVECPFCDYINDFMNEDDFFEIAHIGDNKKLVEPYEMTCEECKKEFVVDESIY